MTVHVACACRWAGLGLTLCVQHGACLGVLPPPSSMYGQAWGSHGFTWCGGGKSSGSLRGAEVWGAQPPPHNTGEAGLQGPHAVWRPEGPNLWPTSLGQSMKEPRMCGWGLPLWCDWLWGFWSMVWLTGHRGMVKGGWVLWSQTWISVIALLLKLLSPTCKITKIILAFSITIFNNKAVPFT